LKNEYRHEEGTWVSISAPLQYKVNADLIGFFGRVNELLLEDRP
jgi:hypothetical protein